MHLGYLVPEFPGQTHAFFWREAQALSAQGFTVHFLSTRRPSGPPSTHPFAARAATLTTYLGSPDLLRVMGYLLTHPARLAAAISYIASLPDTPLFKRLPLLALIVPAAQLVLTARRKGITHVHIHSFANAAHIGALAQRLGGPSYSLTLHGDLDVYGTDHRAKVARAAVVTAVTEPLAEQIRQLHMGPAPHVISMGVDVDRFTPDPAPHDGPVRIVSIARLNFVKGHGYLLDAMAALVAQGMDLHYTIAGDGPHRVEIAAKAASLGLTSRVTFTGAIGEDAVLALLRQSDIFALTSFGLGEAAPVAVMEAMACGLAVICSRIGGTAAMIEDGKDGILVPQQDVPAITAALQTLAADPALRQRIGHTARESALVKFDYRAKASELGQAIRDAQKQDAPPA